MRPRICFWVKRSAGAQTLSQERKPIMTVKTVFPHILYAVKKTQFAPWQFVFAIDKTGALLAQLPQYR